MSHRILLGVIGCLCVFGCGGGGDATPATPKTRYPMTSNVMRQIQTGDSYGYSFSGTYTTDKNSTGSMQRIDTVPLSGQFFVFYSRGGDYTFSGSPYPSIRETVQGTINGQASQVFTDLAQDQSGTLYQITDAHGYFVSQADGDQYGPPLEFAGSLALGLSFQTSRTYTLHHVNSQATLAHAKTCVVIGREDVDTPFGIFDAYKIACTTDDQERLSPLFGGGVHSTSDETLWVHTGFGVVKVVESLNEDPGLYYERFDTVSVLVDTSVAH